MSALRSLSRLAKVGSAMVVCACGVAPGVGADDSGAGGDSAMTKNPSADAGADAEHKGVPDAESDRDASHVVSDASNGLEAGHDAGPTGLHASGNKLVSGAGQPVSLHGVDLNGTEYKCAQGEGVFDTPITAATVSAMVAWNINAVRIGLNEDCWLAINGADPTYSGVANYQTPIESAVSLVTQAGIVVILELHWSSSGSALALGQEPMPTATSLTMWRQVATAFKGNGSVVFDLYNEPVLLQGFTDKAGQTYQGIPATQAWDCWKNGQSASNSCGGFPAVGMQPLLDAVRAAGADNLVMLGGLNYSNDLTAWPANVPTDSAKNLAASFHGYGDGTNEYFVVGTQSSTPTANVNSMLGAVLTAGYPVVIGEFGSSASGSGTFAETDMTSLMTWADTNDVSYLAFSWVHYGIALVDLITDFTTFDPTPQWGTFYQTWLKAH